MRLLQLLILTLILVSCGTSRIKYVRAKGQPQEIIAETESFESHSREETPEIVQQSITEDVSSEFVEDYATEKASSVENSDPIKIENKTVKSDERVSSAFRAERQAKSARSMLISSTALLPIIFFPLATLVGIILLIIGAIKYNRANQSRYITLPGERALNQAKIFLYISLGILVAMAILIAVGLVLLFL